MPTDSFALLLQTWQVFCPCLTRPAFARMLVVATGWVLTHARTRAVTEALVATGLSGILHHEAFHRFFSRGTWKPDALGLALLDRLVGRAPKTFHLVLDDTLASKKGEHVWGICSHLDAVRSTKAVKVFTFGHCWVMLCLLVRVPFSRRPWALPILLRLYRSKKDCEKKGYPYRKKTELGRELVDIVASHFPEARIDLSADSGYCNSTLMVKLAANVNVIGSMRPDAVLTTLPSPGSHSPKGGRPCLRGPKLPKPQELAQDASVPWRKCKANVYGRKRDIEYKALCGQWYRAAGTRLLVIVVTRCWTGTIPFRVYFCTDPTRSIKDVIEGYACRWAIEVLFRELKQSFGFADSCARTMNAVLRTAPFVALLYTSLVTWFLHGHYGLDHVSLPVRPWYTHKRDVCFNDILRAARTVLAECDVLDLAKTFADLRVTYPTRLDPRENRVRMAC